MGCGVRVFNFRSVTSPVFFQNSPPMSIKTSNFTTCHRIFLQVSSKTLLSKPFFAYCPANFELASPLILSKQKTGIAPGPRMKLNTVLSFTTLSDSQSNLFSAKR